jgi:6-phospho-3-hexuloisomerase
MLAMRLAQAGLTVHVAGEVTCPACGAGDLLLIGSGSGRTATMQALAAQAREAGAKLLLLTRAPASPLAQSSDLVIHLPVPGDATRPGGLAGRQPLGTLFEQALVLTGDLLFARLRDRLGLDDAALQARHANLE